RRWRRLGHGVRAVQLEREESRNVASIGLRIVGKLAGGQAECSTPTDFHGNVLLAVRLVGDWRRQDSGVCLGRPQTLAVVGLVGSELTHRGALKDQVACS